MAELTLKDESVIDIGQAVGERVQSIASTGTSIVPAGAGAVAPAAVAQPMNPFDSMMTVLSDIRDGIFSLVDKFSEGVSLQKQEIQADEQAQDLNQAAGSEPVDGIGDSEGPDGPGFFAKAKEKVSSLMGAGGFKGLLVKGGLIFGLLGIAKMLQKYGAEIAKALAPIVDGIKTFYGYVKDDVGVYFDDIFDFFKGAVTGIVNIFKGIFGDGENKGDLLRDGIAELLTLPAKFLSAIGKLALGVLDAFLGVFGMNDPKPEWLTKMYEFLDELPAKVKQFFVDVMEFFTVTIPEKIQSAKDTVTQWFTDAVAGVKQFFTDVGNFFTVTIPTKLTETYNNITSFFGDIVGGVKGFFTDAFDFVTETIPEKMSEITKGISDKFTSIKDQIIDFAMTPFRKIRELFDNLVIGILESVEDIPLIGGKAKEMKESILMKREEKAAALEAAETKSTAFERLKADVDKYGSQINEFMAMSGYSLDMKGSLYNYEEGRNKLAFEKNGGNTLASIKPDTFEDMNEIKYIMQTGSNIGYVPPTTGGVSGEDLNTQSADLASQQGNAMGYVNTGGNDYSVKTNTVTHNSFSEDTTSPDKNSREALYP